MNIDKAIEISTKVINHEMPCWMPKALEAQKLGVEALVLYRNIKQDHPTIVPKLLNGETEASDSP